MAGRPKKVVEDVITPTEDVAVEYDYNKGNAMDRYDMLKMPLGAMDFRVSGKLFRDGSEANGIEFKRAMSEGYKIHSFTVDSSFVYFLMEK
jgi:hypothetical protein